MVDLSNWFNDESTEVKPDEYYENMTVKIKGTLGQVNLPKSRIMEDYGYAIIKVNVLEVLEGELHPTAKNYRGMISIKGEMSRIEGGVAQEFTIELDEIDEQWGASYKLIFKRQDFDFKDIEQQRIFFETFLTETQIVNIFEAFDNPIEVLDNKDITSLCKVKGIGEVLAEKILDRYEYNKDYAEAYIELSQYDISTSAIHKLCDKYGSPDALVAIIKDNPYLLIEVDGYGFKKADQIALRSGIDENSTKRVMAFINYTLNEMGEQGMSWIDSEHLVYLIEENLGDVDMSVVLESVNTLKDAKQVWNEEHGKIGSMKFYNLELKIVKELYRLMTAHIETPDKWEDRIRQAELLQGYSYTDEQKGAIRKIIESPVTCVIGKAGTGKTTSVLGGIKALGDINFAQCALSGKASARLEEATGMRASTIHRLLGFKPNGDENPFEYNKDNQLFVDALIGDESSMIGGSIFLKMLEAIPTGARLVLIGDIRQLSPVGAMNVFYDFVKSGVVPLAELLKIHRQALKSAVITESHKVSDGVQLFDKDFEGVVTLGELQDLVLDISVKSWQIPDKVLEYFKLELERVKDVIEVQVLSPMNTRGDTSVYELNKLIQEWYNPQSEGKTELICKLDRKRQYNFRVGDKVMCVKNNYKLEDMQGKQVPVFNGYTGIIEDIVGDNIIVDFPLANTEEYVVVPSSHWNGKKGLTLAYCATTAKSQGSGFKSVIYAIDNSHYMLLCKEQLYTAMTRAKEKMILVGQRNAVIQAIDTDEASNKQTFIPMILPEFFSGTNKT